ncbi:defensin-like protein 182, partial [Tanacetum coccineum]
GEDEFFIFTRVHDCICLAGSRQWRSALAGLEDGARTVFAQSVNEPVRHKSEEHPLDTCNSSLGHCSRECQTKCCNQNCGIRYYGGKGYCVDIPRGGSLCQCHYPC